MAVKPARKGLWHMVDATRYSLAGFRRLLAETAARLELASGILAVGALFWAGAQAWHWLGFAVLFAALLAVEALNTAIEIIVDHISPGWSEAAKQAKDLGSLAVGLLILCNIGFVGMVVGQRLLGQGG